MGFPILVRWHLYIESGPRTICSYSSTAHDYLVKAPSSCPPNATFAATNMPRTALYSSPGSGNTWMRHLLQVATGRFPVNMPQCARTGPEPYRSWPGSGALWNVHSSGADNCISQRNHSNYDTSNKFGTQTLQGSPCMKITRATQNFNKAAIFQDGHHGLSWNSFYARKWQQKVKKYRFDNKCCVLSM